MKLKALSTLFLCCLLLPFFSFARSSEAPEEGSLTARVLPLLSDAEELITMTGDDLSDLMGIEPEEYVDFAFFSARNALAGREVILLLAADEEAAEQIGIKLGTYLEDRRIETRNYLPEAYKLLSEAEVVREGCLVLLVTGENAAEEVRLLLAGE